MPVLICTRSIAGAKSNYCKVERVTVILPKISILKPCTQSQNEYLYVISIGGNGHVINASHITGRDDKR